MEHLSLSPFQPPFWLKNQHLQTILPKFIHQKTPHYQRELYRDSSDTTFVAYDFVYAKHNKNQDTIVVMFHGLEGNSSSHYAIAFANYAEQQHYDSVIVHYRGCGGVKNSAEKDYNAGDTLEIHHVLQQLSKKYKKIYAIGVSLGGNMLAKYMGEYQDNALCERAVIISAPVDLATSSLSMHKFIARKIYAPYLLKSLIIKALEKSHDKEIIHKIKKIKTLDQFDDLYTAPRHGFGTAKNYYKQASALPFLKNISKPTLIISAKDDPFLGIVATEQDISAQVKLLYSPHGGHVGFINFNRKQKKFDLTWLPQTAFAFFLK